jgi:hypothetical protein
MPMLVITREGLTIISQSLLGDTTSGVGSVEHHDRGVLVVKEVVPMSAIAREGLTNISQSLLGDTTSGVGSVEHHDRDVLVVGLRE